MWGEQASTMHPASVLTHPVFQVHAPLQITVLAYNENAPSAQQFSPESDKSNLVSLGKPGALIPTTFCSCGQQAGAAPWCAFTMKCSGAPA